MKNKTEYNLNIKWINDNLNHSFSLYTDNYKKYLWEIDWQGRGEHFRNNKCALCASDLEPFLTRVKNCKKEDCEGDCCEFECNLTCEEQQIKNILE